MKIRGHNTTYEIDLENKLTRQTNALTKPATFEDADNPALPGMQNL